MKKSRKESILSNTTNTTSKNQKNIQEIEVTDKYYAMDEFNKNQNIK